MGATDLLLSALILGGAAYLFYRSAWKNKGHCPGCCSGSCSTGGSGRSLRCTEKPAKGEPS